MTEKDRGSGRAREVGRLLLSVTHLAAAACDAVREG